MTGVERMQKAKMWTPVNLKEGLTSHYSVSEADWTSMCHAGWIGPEVQINMHVQQKMTEGKHITSSLLVTVGITG